MPDLTTLTRSGRLVSQPIQVPRRAPSGLEGTLLPRPDAQLALHEARASLSNAHVFSALEILWTVEGHRWARDSREFPIQPCANPTLAMDSIWNAAKNLCDTDPYGSVRLSHATTGPVEPRILPTQPAVLLLGHSWECTSRQAHFELAFWAEMARMDKLIFSSVELHDVDDVVAGLFTAFSDSQPVASSARAAVLAAEFRRACPQHVQRTLRNTLLLGRKDEKISSFDLWTHALTLGAFAGYLMSGSLNLCMHKLDECLDDLPGHHAWAQEQLIIWAKQFQSRSLQSMP